MKNKSLTILIILFLFTCFCLKAQESQQTIDSLLNVLERLSFTSNEIKLVEGSDTTKINILNKLGKYYRSIGSYKEALQYSIEAKTLSETIGFKKGEAFALGNIGIIYDQTGDYKNSLISHLKSLEIRKAIGEKRGIASSFISIGILYVKLGNYEKSMQNYFLGLKILEELGDKKASATTYNNIGNIYFNRSNYEKALDYYQKSLKIQLETENKEGASLAYGNIGAVYLKQHKYSEALSNQFISLKLCEEINDIEGVSISYSSIGSIYEEQMEYQKALNFQLKSLKIVEKNGNPSVVAGDYCCIANIYFKQKNSNEAISYGNKALTIFKNIGHKAGMKESCLLLSDAYNQSGKYQEAFNYHKQYSDLKDSLLNEESSKQITEMNAKYESEKKEKEIELLTKDKELQGAEISKQKLIRNGTIGGLVIALLFAFVLLNRFKVTNRQKKIIEYQNSQIVESINYSKKIQDSLLPSVSQMQQALPSLFVFNNPKDIVSGDFYYLKEVEKYIVIACVDCTGHGVPGGFMSTLGSLLLDKIVDSGVLQPSEILLKLSDEIIRVLHQQNGGDIQDGMDLSVCLIDKGNNILEFSGARNGIVIVSNNEARRYKANPLPVGGNYIKKGVAIIRDFQTEKIQLQPSDWVYMYTDGFMEQSGGVGALPMTSIEFENKLISLSQQAAENKMQYLQTELDAWKGINKRADDVLIIGFTI